MYDVSVGVVEKGMKKYNLEESFHFKKILIIPK